MAEMRYGLDITSAGEWGRPDQIAELAALAEDHGWDGVFCEDYLDFPSGGPTYDVWVTLGLVAQATTRLTLGTMVTPLPCRHPATVALQAKTSAAHVGRSLRARRRLRRPQRRPGRVGPARSSRRPARGSAGRGPRASTRRADLGRRRDHQGRTTSPRAAVGGLVPLPRAAARVGGPHARRRRRAPRRRARAVVRRAGRRPRAPRRPRCRTRVRRVDRRRRRGLVAGVRAAAAEPGGGQETDRGGPITVAETSDVLTVAREQPLL